MTPYPKALALHERIRQSRLASFDRCALSAHFDDLYRDDWSSHPQARGTITHRVFADCLRAMHRMGSPTIEVDVALSIFYDVARQNGVDDRCGKCNAPSAFDSEKGKVVCEQGHMLSSNFVNLPADHWKDIRWITIKFAKESTFDIANLVDIEQRLYTSVEYPDGEGGHVERQLTGALDALFIVGETADHAIVLDWKDTWMLPAPTAIGFDGYFQQKFYAWLVMKNYPTVQRVTLREHYVRYGESREADVWRAELDEVEEMLSAVTERYDRSVQEENFPPSPGAHCQSMCSRPDKCPIFPAVRVEGAITDKDMALRYAREATIARSALESRLKQLRPWSDVNGPLEVSDHKGKRVWGYHQRTRVDRPDRDKMAQALRNVGAHRILDVDGFLSELYIENAQTKFEMHQPDETTHMGQGETDEILMAALAESVERHHRS